MPKPRQTYISPKHVFDAELTKLPGSRKQMQRKELAKRLKYPEIFADNEDFPELDETNFAGIDEADFTGRIPGDS